MVKEVVIDALAVMKIAKHCDENFPSLVNGTLLGLDINGVLEITYSFPSLQKSENSKESDGNDKSNETITQQDIIEYQTEMMRMLRDVNIDNNCVGWYQSSNLGTVSTKDIIAGQYNFQTKDELSSNSVVLMYDPLQSSRGELSLKAFRLSNAFLALKRSKQLKFIRPQEILEEVPIRIRTNGHLSGLAVSLQDTHEAEIDCDFDPLNTQGVETLAEKYLESFVSRLDDLLAEQGRFQAFARANAKSRQEQLRWLAKRRQENEEARENGDPELSTKIADSGLKAIPDVSNRHDHLLVVAQIDRYCQQLNEHLGTSLEKLTLVNQINQVK